MDRTKRLNWKILVFRLFVSLALISSIFLSIDISKMAQGLEYLSHWTLITAIILCFSQMVLAGLRWFLIGKMTGPFLNISAAFRINFAAMFSNQILPTSIGGDLVKVGLSRNTALSVGRAIRTVILDRVTGLISLMMLLLVTSFLMDDLLPPYWPIFALKILAGSFVVVTLVILFLGESLADSLPKLALLKWVKQFLRESNALGREGMMAFCAVALSLGIHCIGAVCLWYLALAVGVETDYMTILGVLPIISLVQLVPISIAGWGIREGTVVALFSILGIDASLALLVSLIWGFSIACAALISGGIWVAGRQNA